MKKLRPSKESLNSWLSQIQKARNLAGDNLDEIHLLPVDQEIQIVDKGKIQTTVFSGSEPVFNDSKDSFKFASPGVFYVSTSVYDEENQPLQNKPRYRRVYVSCPIKIRQEHMGIVRDWITQKPTATEPAAVPSLA